jgi:hypothetical protein
MFGFTWAMTMRAVCTAASEVSTETPSEQKPWRSGGDTCRMATSRSMVRDRKSAGMSDRNTGMKSAAPASMAARTGGPAKSDTDRKRSRCAASTNGAGPIVCRW